MCCMVNIGLDQNQIPCLLEKTLRRGDLYKVDCAVTGSDAGTSEEQVWYELPSSKIASGYIQSFHIAKKVFDA